MEKTLQDKFKKELNEHYLSTAFEAFANYALLGKKSGENTAAEKNYTERIKECEIKLAEATDYEIQKSLKKDIQRYKDAAKSTRDVLKRIHDESAQWQTKASAALERADFVLTFKVNTPEEIAEAKQKREDAAKAKVDGSTVDTVAEAK